MTDISDPTRTTRRAWGRSASTCATTTGDLPAYVYLPTFLGWGDAVRRPGIYGGFLGQRYDPLFSECRPVRRPGRRSRPREHPPHVGGAAAARRTARCRRPDARPPQHAAACCNSSTTSRPRPSAALAASTASARRAFDAADLVAAELGVRPGPRDREAARPLRPHDVRPELPDRPQVRRARRAFRERDVGHTSRSGSASPTSAGTRTRRTSPS